MWIHTNILDVIDHERINVHVFGGLHIQSIKYQLLAKKYLFLWYRGLWCLTPLSTICGSQFCWWRKPEYPEKTTDLPQVTDNLYQVHSSWAGFEFTMLEVIATDCIDSCKSNYHTIMTKAAPSYDIERRAASYLINICFKHY